MVTKRRMAEPNFEEIGMVLLANKCNQTAGGVEWKNRKFVAKQLCAKNADDAVALVSEEKIRATITADANNAIGDLDCASITGCPAPRRCVEGKLQLSPIIVTQEATAATCRNTNVACGEAGSGETIWECTFRADVTAEKHCECKRPA